MKTAQGEQLGQAIRYADTRKIGSLPLLYSIISALEVHQLTNGLIPDQREIDPGLAQLVTLLLRSNVEIPNGPTPCITASTCSVVSCLFHFSTSMAPTRASE